MSYPNLLQLISGACLIGTAPIFVRFSNLAPVTSAFWRMFIAFFAVLMYLKLTKHWSFSADFTQQSGKSLKISKQILSNRHSKISLIAGVCFALDLGLWHWSITTTSVSIATFVVNLAPVFLLIIHGFIYRPNSYFRVISIVCCAVVGLYLTTKSSSDNTNFIGVSLALLAAIFYAGYLYFVDKAGKEKSDPLTVLLLSMLSCWIVLLPISLFENLILHNFSLLDSLFYFFPLSLVDILSILGLVFLVQILGQFLIVKQLPQFSVYLSAPTLLLQPVVATLLGVVLFSEKVSSTNILGMLFLIAVIVAAKLVVVKQNENV